MSRALSTALLCMICLSASAQTLPYVGAISGISTLSADAGSQLSGQNLSLSSYKPDNGGVVNVFAGLHLREYYSLQANYIWSQHDVLLGSTFSGSDTFYVQTRTSSQQVVVLDFLLYFRRRTSRVRPYLGTGGGITHFSSSENQLVASGGMPTLPPSSFSSNRPVFRSHVGIDLRLSRRLDFRYSFSEMIANNDLSRHLSPPAPRHLANFDNLFGFVLRF